VLAVLTFCSLIVHVLRGLEHMYTALVRYAQRVAVADGAVTIRPYPSLGAQSSVCEWGMLYDVIVIMHASHVC
jgi:hypothetical protein